mmetsp:Transcript_8955/g.18372  ORF Transcript_8955/g.18372 Transcript_8955/m.18372 type:complete len:208 (+) Transcript_8955:275-898(+)
MVLEGERVVRDTRLVLGALHPQLALRLPIPLFLDLGILDLLPPLLLVLGPLNPRVVVNLLLPLIGLLPDLKLLTGRVAVVAVRVGEEACRVGLQREQVGGVLGGVFAVHLGSQARPVHETLLLQSHLVLKRPPLLARQGLYVLEAGAGRLRRGTVVRVVHGARGGYGLWMVGGGGLGGAVGVGAGNNAYQGGLCAWCELKRKLSEDP